MQMHSRKNYFAWLFSLVLMAVLLGALELGARMVGYSPGDVSPNWLNFKAVDSLQVYNDLDVNEDGILTGNTSQQKVYGLPINSKGFNTPEFTQVDTTKSTVMLIGDSFTWGMSATHSDSAFANILRRESGWNVHNLGIPAADPVQYALVAERHLSELQPDVVMLIFFVGNDIMLHDRQAAPFRDFYFFTNAGAILTDVDGIHFPDAHAAYAYLMHDKYWLTGERNLWEWFISMSAVLSRLYSVRFRWEEKQRWETAIEDLSLTTGYVRRVRNAALAHGADFHIIVIPEIKEAEMAREDYEARYGSFFHHPELQPFIAWPVTEKNMFNPYPDAHLNNNGHRVYADFIRQKLSRLTATSPNE